MSRLTDAEIDRLLVVVQQKCDRVTVENLKRLLSESRELRDQHAERQHMYDLEPDEG
jgi:predicted YcjX-like family ATPase